jgi:hypothetical protein
MKLIDAEREKLLKITKKDGAIWFVGFEGDKERYLSRFKLLRESGGHYTPHMRFSPGDEHRKGLNQGFDGALLPDQGFGNWLKVPDDRWGSPGGAVRIVYMCSPDGKPQYQIQVLGGKAYITYESHDWVLDSKGGRSSGRREIKLEHTGDLDVDE